MHSNFADVVEEVKMLSFDEKEELKYLLDKYLIEEGRERIYKNYEESLRELSENKLEFTHDTNRLKEMLNE